MATGQEDVLRWSVPAMEHPDTVLVSEEEVHSSPVITAQQLEAVEQQAREEGFSQGRQEGLAQALAAGREQVQSMIQQLSRPLNDLDERVVDELSRLAIAIARQIVRRELRAEPGEVVAAVRQALDLLPVQNGQIHIYLHPEDLPLVQDALSMDDSSGWQLKPDPALTRGGCRLETRESTVDATVETRLAAVAAQVLGSERASGQADDE